MNVFYSELIAVHMAMKRLILAAIICLFLVLIYDVVWKEFPHNLKIQQQPAAVSQAEGNVKLLGVRYDVPSHSIKATPQLEIISHDKTEISEVSFSIMQTGPKQVRSWLLSATPACQMEPSENTDSAGNAVPMITMSCNEITLNSDFGRNEILYPFDGYKIVLAPRACINNPNGACVTGDQSTSVSINSFEVSVIDQNFIGSLYKSVPNSYKVELSRRFFVRFVSVIFLIFSLIFLVYLVMAGDPKDLLPKSLGFFATLWGLRALIVPSSITVFPTLVDYCILSIFSILFLLVFMKVYPEKR